MRIRAGFQLLLLTLLLVGCGGGSSGEDRPDPTPDPVTDPTPDPTPDPEGYNPTPADVGELRLLDATSQPLADVAVQISPTNGAIVATGFAVFNSGDTLTTDLNGDLAVSGLAPGNYSVTIKKNNTQASIALVVEAVNSITNTTLAMPVVIESDGELSLVDEEAFVAAFNGVIYSNDGPVEGAQIEISAGAASNGAIATAQTNHQGEFVLVLNVGGSLTSALNNTSVRVIADGYQPLLVTGQDIQNVQAISGYNLRLISGQSSGQIVYQETFENLSAGAACGQWTSEALFSYSSGGENIDLWNQHSIGRGILNQALVQNLVKLAPDDTSAGYVPEPLSGTACWYGQAEAGLGQGNFLGEPVEDVYGDYGSHELDGGTSLNPHGGALISPVIDLTQVGTPLALTFRNWWEIESVNPNDEGYDLMSVQYREEGATAWTTLARLNPLSDPAGLEERAPLPYSNRGYNRAPAWLWQEPIPLDQLAGKRVQLRLTFRTVDELYNGFRGWLVDDVRIVREVGTFPLWTGFDDWDEDWGDDEPWGGVVVSNITPVPAGEGNFTPLAIGVSQTVSVSVNYPEADDVQIVMNISCPIGGCDNSGEQIGQLPSGQSSGQLSGSFTPSEEGLVLIVVSVLDGEGEAIAAYSFFYFVGDND